MIFAVDMVIWGEDIREVQRELNEWNRHMKVSSFNIREEKSEACYSQGKRNGDICHNK